MSEPPQERPSFEAPPEWNQPPAPPNPAPPNPAPPNPAAPNPADEELVPERKTQRPHPLTPLIRGWVALVAGVVWIGQEFLPDGSGQNPDLQDVPWWIFLVGILVIALMAGLASFFSWWYTQFVIDEVELRVETGMFTKSSKRIPFAKVQSVDVVQPLAARIFGLCELRIDAGAGDSSVTLRYLTRKQAYQWRDYLLARAHGIKTTVAEAARRPESSAFDDLSAADVILVRLDPGRLIGALLLSTEFLASIVIMVAIMSLSVWAGAGALSLGVIFPFVIGVVSLVGRRVISQFNYTLARAGQGLRVTRGLTQLTSQSIPVDRIQGVRVDQSILWRLTDWYRVEIDVLGYSGSGQSNERPSGTLLPVASRRELEIALAHVLPGVDLNFPLAPVPKRARWLNPLSWWTMRYGANDRVVVGERGWLEHSRRIVPHAKTQSVRLTQGPVQRLNRLASVHVDTTPGPVTQVLHDVDADYAYRFTRDQLPRAAAARRRGPITLPPMPPMPSMSPPPMPPQAGPGGWQAGPPPRA